MRQRRTHFPCVTIMHNFTFIFRSFFSREGSSLFAPKSYANESRQIETKPSPFISQTDLKRPELCEKEVWSLLQECWNREEKSRPNFAEILLFLKRKAMNFDMEV